MHLHHIRRGEGAPLVLIHGLGSTGRSWRLVVEALAAERQVIALDLPSHGETPPLPGPATFAGLADAVAAFLDAQTLVGAAVVGSSMGARLALELARRGLVGATVALDPGGFWEGWERHAFYASLAASIRLVRALLFAQLSAHAARLPPDLARDEMRSPAACPTFDALLKDLAYGPEQAGAAQGATRGPVTLGWGRRDRVCRPAQAARASKVPRRGTPLVRPQRPLPAVGQAGRDRALDPRPDRMRRPADACCHEPCAVAREWGGLRAGRPTILRRGRSSGAHRLRAGRGRVEPILPSKKFLAL